MAVPEQVRKQTEAVQKLYEELGPEKTETPAPASNVTELPKATADRKTKTVPADKPAAVEPDAGASNNETFEQKYKTLQGMFNSQVPRLEAQNKELVSRLQSMEQLIASMQAAPPPPSAPAPAAPPALLTDAERTEYGDSIDVMRKVTQEVVQPYQAEIQRLNTLVSQMQGVVPRVERLSNQQAQSSEQMFWSQLTSLVPEWQTINNNPDFQTWLLEIDPLSRVSRQSYLEDAQKNLDVRRVAGFFSAWNGGGSVPEARSNRSAPATELERQVAPGRARNTGTAGTNQPKTYTPQDISSFFNDVKMGRYKGREQERGQIERDIFAAQREGRIVQP